ncbi:MAG TPA: sugar phosphate nucleotidyltransferase [Mycobacteriales bacterium]|nr:sugar phosphate nucleotidyltransferase [Mycobacteriales bacterium]
MTGDLAALVLAAGEGKRLRPLTELRPKPLCPVSDTTLLDLALDRVTPLVPAEAIAVNAHHLADQIADYLGDRAHLSIEQPEALGTAGAVAAISGWLDGRDVLIANGDVALHPTPDLAEFVAAWDRERPRLLVVEDHDDPDFDDRWRFAGISLLPAAIAATLKPEPSGLFEVVWRNTAIDRVPTSATYVDCGDPSAYLRANLLLSGGESVIGAGASVEGTVERCVVWPGAAVAADERLVEVIRVVGSDGEPLTVAAPQ